jgi:hypothetical protein
MDASMGMNKPSNCFHPCVFYSKFTFPFISTVLKYYRFSRKLMWLNVGPSNNDQAIVARNFVERVQDLQGYSQLALFYMSVILIKLLA